MWPSGRASLPVSAAASPVCVQYPVKAAHPQFLSLSELSQSLLAGCWASVSLSSLLPDGGSALTRSEISSMLAWSFSLQSNSRLR